jgi:hypothetical protein
MTLGIVLSIWWLIGLVSFFAICVFRWKEVTYEDLVVSLFGAMLGPITTLAMLAILGQDRVIWRKK